MKDFGPLHYLLGLDVLVHDIGIYLQAKYPSNLISRAGLNDSKAEARPDFTEFENTELPEVSLLTILYLEWVYRVRTGRFTELGLKGPQSTSEDRGKAPA
uniref:Uncharacterized protein n=1 Tax=Lactuca sativa TaxID=4236 RepID=A0A9R1WXM4_LACSA|nr:hypothetical protein LSAT_V11C800398270 [Lactuca sativa]